MQHTLKTIANDTGESKDTIRKRYERAKAKHGELGTLVKGVRTFTDDERKILDSFAADQKAKPEPKATVNVVSEPAHGASITPSIGELVFNPAALLDCTNGADGTVTALEQMAMMTQIMIQNVEGTKAKALHDCERICDSSKAVGFQLQDLKLKISEARAVTTMSEFLKRQAVKEGIEAQAEIESMMQKGE